MADHTPEREMPAREIAPDTKNKKRVFTNITMQLVDGDGGEYTWEMPEEAEGAHRVMVLCRKGNGQLVRYLVEVNDGSLSLSRDE